MEGVKIVLMCVIGAVIYGICHDMITAHLAVEYFKVNHPDIFHTANPALLALGWVVVATWWFGFFLGLLLAGAARIGKLPKLSWRNLLKPTGITLALTFVAAMCAGLIWHALTGSVLASVAAIHNTSYNFG